VSNFAQSLPRHGAVLAGEEIPPVLEGANVRFRSALLMDLAGLVSRGKFVSLLMQLEDTKMHMSGESLLIILVVGLIAGWLAGQIVQGTGFGIVGDLLIGIAGAFIGSWLLPQLGLHLGSGIISAIINATIGALLLLLIIRLVRGGGGWRRSWGGSWGRRW
jgi:uncharacterized membrane protein YeaQ/YmgE (transglycosylase-associated protein family)